MIRNNNLMLNGQMIILTFTKIMLNCPIYTLICLSLWHMAHGTVTFTCFNHKIGVVILHKVNIWQVVEELHYNIQIVCLKYIIWSTCGAIPTPGALQLIQFIYTRVAYSFDFLLCFDVLEVKIEKYLIICFRIKIG